MRCPDCNKWVPYDTEQDPEEQDELSFDGVRITGSYRRVLPCEECSAELKEATIEFDFATATTFENGCAKNEAHEWEFDVEVTPTSEQKGRRGPMFYGVQVEGTVTCRHCHDSVEFSMVEQVQASAFDELV